MGRGVEFVDEGLDDPAQPPPARRRPSPLIVLVAAVVVAAGLIAWIATRPSSPSPPQARKGPQVETITERATPSAASPTAARSTGVQTRDCVIGMPSSADIAVFARHAFPSSSLLSDQSYRCSIETAGGIETASQSVAIQVGKIVIEVQASRRVGDAGQYIPVPAGRTLLHTSYAQSAALEVSVAAYGKPGTRAPSAAMQSLASDLSLSLVF